MLATRGNGLISFHCYFNSLLNWLHGCDLMQSLLQHAKLLGTRDHAPMVQVVLKICSRTGHGFKFTPHRCLKLYESVQNGYKYGRTRDESQELRGQKKQLVRSEVLAGLTFSLSFLSRERSNMFDQFFDVMRYDFRTLSEQTSKVLTSSVMS